MNDVALGVKVFSRYQKLKQLLTSIEDTSIGKVYVADDGEPDSEERQVYEGEYSFDLQVLKLPYDAGLGYGRKRIVDEMSEDFLLIVDSDHQVPENVSLLREQLESRPDIGGISGLFFEQGTIAGSCHDLYQEANTLVRDIRTEKSRQMCAGAPLIEFDFIPNAALFRRECLEAYCWDEKYVIGYEHIDFYVGHKKQTDWKFAVSPAVLFSHNPGGSTDYMNERMTPEKHRNSRSHFLDKWGYDDLIWMDTFPPDYRHGEVVLNQYILGHVPLSVRLRMIRLLKRLNKFRMRL